MEEVHVDGAERIARLTRECGVQKLIHVSSNNAHPAPTPVFMRGGSEFLRTKYEGEVRVRDVFPDATIMRPAEMFGFDDRFLHYYADTRRRWFRSVPLYRRGEYTTKMPVFSGDVGQGIIKAMKDPEAVGQLYECVGPRTYTNAEIVDYIYRCIRRPGTPRIPVDPLFRLYVAAYTKFLGKQLNMERLEMESISTHI